MDNSRNLSQEEQYNDRFLELTAQIRKQKAILANLEQQQNNVYIHTTFYRLGEEHKRMLDDYHDEECNF